MEEDSLQPRIIINQNESAAISESERVYVESGNSKIILYLLCIGTPSAIDLDEEPWKSQPRRSVVPQRKQYQDEVVRRANILQLQGREMPRPSGWSVEKCINELKTKFIITNQDDMLFLSQECTRVTTILVAAQEEAAATAVHLQQGFWRGPVPFLRLIHCLVDNDDIKSAFLRRAIAQTRAQLDARNSLERAPTVYELLADKWNSPNFNPTTTVLQVHQDFATPIDCSHAQVATLTPADASKVEDYVTKMRSSLLRIITNWEQSGQGEGGHVAGDNDTEDQNSGIPSVITMHNEGFGSLADRPPEALQTRAAFLLAGMPPYLLYYWELSDRHQLLSSALQRLDDTVSASDGASAPSTDVRINARRQRRRSTEHDNSADQIVTALAASLNAYTDVQRQELAAQRKEREEDVAAHFRLQQQQQRGDEIAAKRRRIESLEDRETEYRRMYFETPDPNSPIAQFYINTANQMAQQIQSLNEEITQSNQAEDPYC